MTMGGARLGATVLAEEKRERVAPRFTSARARRVLGHTLIYVIVALGAIIELVPFFWMLTSSLKPTEELFFMPPKYLPSRLVWSNYPEALSYLPFARFFGNTVVIVVTTAIGVIFSSSLVAFSFARLRWPGREKVFLIFLAAMMIPEAARIIPEYVVFKHLNWTNTYYPLIIPTFLAPPYFVFLLRQFFLTIPREMDDAARIDGCSSFGIYSKIILPMSTPALGVVAVYQFIGAWNDFFRPLIYIHNEGKYTVALGLRMFHNAGVGATAKPWSQLMAVSLIATLPVMVVFFFLQRLFIQGIVISGVKG